MKFYLEYQSPVGTILLGQEGEYLTQLWLPANPPSTFKSEFAAKDTPLLLAARLQLEEYFADQRKTFDLPLAPKGTVFQEKVWKALQTIPHGTTISYKELAEKVGSPKGYRAVGGANGKNPISIIVPCHRVIAANGALGGYSSGLDAKIYLLKLEQG